MDQKDEVKSKVDLVEVIASYIPLKKAGRNLAALCPFHSEKTPSLMISPERQVWRCFGCSEGGDVFTFVEKMESWDFREALEELAKRAGVKLTGFAPTGASRLKEKLIAINNLTLKFYKYLLLKHKVGAKGREYLEGRGIPTGLWEKFDLGFAPSGWEALWQFLTKRGFALSDIATAGLIIGRGAGELSLASRRSGYYDRFRNRIMFPLKDSHGTILGFAGRTIEDPPVGGREAPLRQDSVGQAKYINCPQTPIFNKGSLLFGLDVARSAIREKNEVVLVEGEFDVISVYKAGVFNVVASKGTALTEKQVATLSRVSERVILCFDTDLAGDAAARRGIELLDLAGMHVAVARLGKFKDPDQFAQKDAPGFKKAIAKSSNVYDYFIDSAIARFDPKTAEGKKKIGREVLPVLASITDDLVRAHYIGRLANRLDLEIQFVAEAVESKRGLGGEGGEKQTFDEETGVNKSLSQEEYLLALVVGGETLFGEMIGLLAPSDFANAQAGRFWKFLGDIIKSSKARNTKQIMAKLPQELGEFIDNLYLVQVSPEILERDFLAREITKTAKMIRRDSLKRKLTEISGKLAEAELSKNQRQMAVLLRHFRQISEEIKKVTGS